MEGIGAGAVVEEAIGGTPGVSIADTEVDSSVEVGTYRRHPRVMSRGLPYHEWTLSVSNIFGC